MSAVFLPCGATAEAREVLAPSSSNGDASDLYASLFTEDERSSIRVQQVPFSRLLEDGDDTDNDIVLVYSATDSPDEARVNRLANDVLQLASDAQAATVTGNAYVLYRKQDRDFKVRPDWEALHDVAYGARMRSLGKLSSTAAANTELVEAYKARYEALCRKASTEDASENDMEADDAEQAIDEEDARRSDEPRQNVNSEDESGNEEGTGQDDDEEEDEDDEDSQGSYEDESELESDDDDDPRKKALLDMIKAALTKDGQLDLER
ncbi:hypothetical protein EMMF5_002337 [Cystobasidiomycetes sp. EMM_F5]